MTAAKGLVVPAGGGKRLDSPSPGRFFDLKLLGPETGESIMMFEETLPVGTASLFHLHRDSDEVAWVLDGEFSFMIGDEVTSGGPGICAFMPRDVPHAWKNTGSDTGRVLFLYTPAAAGGYIEELCGTSPDHATTSAPNSASATAGKSSAPIRCKAGPQRAQPKAGCRCSGIPDTIGSWPKPVRASAAPRSTSRGSTPQSTFRDLAYAALKRAIMRDGHLRSSGGDPARRAAALGGARGQPHPDPRGDDPVGAGGVCPHPAAPRHLCRAQDRSARSSRSSRSWRRSKAWRRGSSPCTPPTRTSPNCAG